MTSTYPIALLLALLTACGGGRGTVRFGAADGRARAPGLEFADGERPPAHLAVQLAETASVAVLWIVPGRGAALVYPTDSTLSAIPALAPGARTLVARYPDAVPGRREEAPVASAAGRGDRRRPGADPSRSSVIAPTGVAVVAPARESEGYLLLVATRAPVDPRALRRRLDGLTIPADDVEALVTVAKLARAPGSPWTGIARRVRRLTSRLGARAGGSRSARSPASPR